MSKFGDDLIQSLKEAVAHAEGKGSGIEQVPTKRRGPHVDVTQAETDDAIGDAN